MPKISSSATRRRTRTSITASSRSCRSSPPSGLNQVDHARVARRRRRLQRLLPSDRRPRADAVLDRQPADHRSAEPLYSNQISQDAVQSMEIITGVAPAEYGDKSSLVVHIVTKSGLDQAKPTGSASFGYGSFKSPDRRAQHRRRLAHGRRFPVGVRAAHRSVPRSAGVRGAARHRQQPVVLQPARLPSERHRHAAPERPGGARPGSTCRTPTTRVAQTQHQNISSFNVAPGYTRVIGSKTLFTANGFVRQDHLTYLPSANRSTTRRRRSARTAS